MQDLFLNHATPGSPLNNHDCAWRKALPGQEIEYKFTLASDAPIWDLATATLHHFRHAAGRQYRLKYHDEFQTWNYDNHLYDIRAPESERGYVSFIPATTADGWRMKRKWFTNDTLIRREQIVDIPAIDDLDAYVHNVLAVEAERMPTFRRTRFDVTSSP